MGPVNWIAVMVAALSSMLVAAVWYGPLFGRAKLEEVGPGGMAVRTSTGRTATVTVILLLLTASMMGHMFARVGPETLAVKPWLYFMMSGGLALFFVIPALWLSYMHQRISTRLGIIDGGYWLVAYLAMGTVFWLLA
ncbi:hypothetical protein MB02_01340 [Croceicoccus estronivorus]|uniref:DUF1761 domain-containing protein n=1 Tax=Croceicoccus estronivorus TaxID=1172626 RepID=UPI000832324B|nr:DUF1761 domain-containing protein [Croceicoccus estronivorus]OCC25342.1 hypothetical protein MB02_01340 [Croceicoccus estronivorus]